VGFYFYGKYQETQALLKNPSLAAQEEISRLVKQVASHMILPGEETPTVATVSDTSKLAGQPFFAKAKTGDKVLIFARDGKAILFRPDVNRIIEVTSVNLEQNVAGASTVSAQLASAKLAIYNGTQTSGLASKAEAKIKTDLPMIETVVKTNSQGDYPKTWLIVLNTQAKDLGAKLAETFRAEVKVDLPTGEAKPEADLLLVLGEDYKP
jgi:hypothetical protein